MFKRCLTSLGAAAALVAALTLSPGQAVAQHHGGGGSHGGGFHGGGSHGGGFHGGGFHGSGFRGGFHNPSVATFHSGGWRGGDWGRNGWGRGWDRRGWGRGWGRDWDRWGWGRGWGRGAWWLYGLGWGYPWYYGSYFYPAYSYDWYGGYPWYNYYPTDYYGWYGSYPYSASYPYAYSPSTYDYTTPYSYGAYSTPSEAYYGSVDQSAVAEQNVARVRVLVPPDAQVWFEGQLTTEGGPERMFATPELEPGREYSYDITAQWHEDGREVTKTAHIVFHAGDSVTADFTQPQVSVRVTSGV
jgi:uncharacterized protein (TIGR03000 family)